MGEGLCRAQRNYVGGDGGQVFRTARGLARSLIEELKTQKGFLSVQELNDVFQHGPGGLARISKGDGAWHGSRKGDGWSEVFRMPRGLARFSPKELKT